MQNIKIHRGQVLTKTDISRQLAKARGLYSYVKFTMHNGKYINVLFTRDNKIEIATNSRDYNIINDIKILKLSYTQAALTNFVFKWIPKLNK